MAQTLWQALKVVVEGITSAVLKHLTTPPANDANRR